MSHGLPNSRSWRFELVELDDDELEVLNNWLSKKHFLFMPRDFQGNLGTTAACRGGGGGHESSFGSLSSKRTFTRFQRCRSVQGPS